MVTLEVILIITLCSCFAILNRSDMFMCVCVVLITLSVVYAVTQNSPTTKLSSAKEVSSQLAKHKHKDDEKEEKNSEISSNFTQHNVDTPLNEVEDADSLKEIQTNFVNYTDDTNEIEEIEDHDPTKTYSKYDVRSQHEAFFNHMLTRNSLKTPDFKAQNRYVNALFLDHEQQTRKTDKYADDS